uniref:C3H1-type domain-containing protein n=1 Tax=Parascaris univalens TaxID=6257 RepID=A0A915AWC7_PARUN
MRMNVDASASIIVYRLISLSLPNLEGEYSSKGSYMRLPLFTPLLLA